MSMTLPRAVDAEQQVVGSLLIEPPLIDLVASKLRPDDFTDSAHREAYSIIADLTKARHPCSESAWLTSQAASSRCARVFRPCTPSTEGLPNDQSALQARRPTVNHFGEVGDLHRALDFGKIV